MEGTFELYRDRAGEYRWRLRAPNGKIIADSAEGYVNKADAERGIALVRRLAPGARLEDLTGGWHLPDPDPYPLGTIPAWLKHSHLLRGPATGPCGIPNGRGESVR